MHSTTNDLPVAADIDPAVLNAELTTTIDSNVGLQEDTNKSENGVPPITEIADNNNIIAEDETITDCMEIADIIAKSFEDYKDVPKHWMYEALVNLVEVTQWTRLNYRSKNESELVIHEAEIYFGEDSYKYIAYKCTSSDNEVHFNACKVTEHQLQKLISAAFVWYAGALRPVDSVGNNSPIACATNVEFIPTTIGANNALVEFIPATSEITGVNSAIISKDVDINSTSSLLAFNGTDSTNFEFEIIEKSAIKTSNIRAGFEDESKLYNIFRDLNGFSEDGFYIVRVGGRNVAIYPMILPHSNSIFAGVLGSKKYFINIFDREKDITDLFRYVA